MAADGIDPAADVAELVELVGRLDADNERLRMRVLELLRIMEESVDAQVAEERRAANLAERVAGLEEELAALQRTKLMRFTRPARSLYARLRRW